MFLVLKATECPIGTPVKYMGGMYIVKEGCLDSLWGSHTINDNMRVQIEGTVEKFAEIFLCRLDLEAMLDKLVHKEIVKNLGEMQLAAKLVLLKGIEGLK